MTRGFSVSRCPRHTQRLMLGEVPLPTTRQTAEQHAQFEAKNHGRWACACAACRMVRECPHRTCKMVGASL